MTESTAYANKGVAFAAVLALHVGGRVKWPGNRLRNATVPLIPPPPQEGEGSALRPGGFR